MTPVVFIHYGKIPEYLVCAITQARKRNEVYLLTDQEEPSVDAITVHINDINEEADRFPSVYSHLSKNPIEFELRCFTRWALLLSFMKKKSIDKVFHCDSDIMLYVSADHVASGVDLAYMIPSDQPEFRWSSSGHSSIFSKQKLEEFWNFILNTYTNRDEMFSELKRKYKHHLSTGKPGGVCDMTLLYLFAEGRDVKSLCSVVDGFTFDLNINSSENLIKEEYDMRIVGSPSGPLNIKNVKMVNGIPYCHSFELDQEIRFNSLHFQGGAKVLMQHFM